MTDIQIQTTKNFSHNNIILIAPVNKAWGISSKSKKEKKPLTSKLPYSHALEDYNNLKNYKIFYFLEEETTDQIEKINVQYYFK